MIGRFVISNIIYTLQMQGPSPLHLSSMDTVPSGIKPVRSYIGDFFDDIRLEISRQNIKAGPALRNGQSPSTKT